jgi:hypothetical protein
MHNIQKLESVETEIEKYPYQKTEIIAEIDRNRTIINNFLENIDNVTL